MDAAAIMDIELGETMPIFCDKCGAQLKNENAKFCDKCGAEVKINNNQNNTGITNTGPMTVCPHCGQTTSSELTHCEKCGLSQNEYTAGVIVGYIVTFILGFFLIRVLPIITYNIFASIFLIITLIPAIYLLTRKSGKAKTQGVFLIGLIILWCILSHIFRYSVEITYLIVILLMAAGIYLWFKDYSLFH